MSQKYREGDEPVPGSGYRLTEFLGRGGFGEVWKASAPGGAEAAMKIIQLGGTEGRKEFRALQLVKRIRHTHLVPIFSFWMKNAEGQIIDDALVGTAETCAVDTKPAEFRATMAAPPMLGRPQATELIIAMGLGDKSLFDRLQECIAEGREGVPQEELLHYLEDAAEAIDFLNRPLHNLGSGPVAIQHCDIKPHNLMIVGGGAQVCDFGLARMMGTDRTTTAAATLAYAAPECLVEGKPSDSTDQYSLAVSYYELKTGLLPYREETLAYVMDAKREGKLDFAKVSPAEQAVLRRATSQNPPDRFPSALEMVTALKRAASSGADAEPTKIYSTSPKRSKMPLVLVVLLLAGIAGGFAYLNRDRFIKQQTSGSAEKPESPQKNIIAEKPPENNSGNQPENPEKNPVHPAFALVKEAKSHIALGEWPAAYEKSQDALRLNPKLVEAYFVRGQCYMNLEPVDYDKAIADFEKAKSLSTDDRYRSSPEFAAAYLARGTAKLSAKRFDEAVADLTEASQYAPRDYRIFSRLGVAWLSIGQCRQAVDAFSVSLRINPTEETDFVNRGRAYRKLDQPEKAIEDYLQAAAIDPQNAEVQLQIGNTYIDLKKPDGAADAFGKAIEILSKSPEAKKTLAQTYLSRGGAYLESIDAHPRSEAENAEVYRKAIDDLSRAARIFDLDDAASLAGLHELRTSCFETLKRDDDAKEDRAIAVSYRLLEKKPDNAEELNTIAYHMATAASADIRDIPKAIAFATRACEIDRENYNYLDTLAAACAAAGQFDQAVKWQTKAVEFAPDEEKKEYQAKLDLYKKGEK